MDSFTFQKTPLVLLPSCISKFQGLFWALFTPFVWWKGRSVPSSSDTCAISFPISLESELGVSKLIWNSVVLRLSNSLKREGFPSLFNMILPSSRISLLSVTERMLQTLSYLNPNGTKSTNMENTSVLVHSCPFSTHQSSRSTTDVRCAAVFTYLLLL